MNKFTLLVLISVFATLIAPKPAEAQWQNWGQRAAEFCAQNGGNRCIPYGNEIFKQVVNPPGYETIWEAHQRRQREEQEMRQRQQQDYNQGRYQNGRGSYGGW